jgi:hypothetical protein
MLYSFSNPEIDNVQHTIFAFSIIPNSYYFQSNPYIIINCTKMNLPVLHFIHQANLAIAFNYLSKFSLKN